ncbi:MAG: AMP-binding protein, partial [Planctomycetota bacterium]
MTDSFVEILAARASTTPQRIAYRFLIDGEVEGAALTFADLDRRARDLATILVERGATGQRVPIVVPPGEQNVVAFFGCLYAGAVAVPVPPPRRTNAFERLRNVCERTQASMILADADTQARAARIGEWAATDRLSWLDVSAVDRSRAGAGFVPRMPSPDDTAFIQFTSGSTGHPKGVQISHGNLIANAQRLRTFFSDDEQTVGVSWLPPFHDMGLIGGILQPVFLGAQTIVMPPTSFIQRPLRWLEAIAKYRATTSGGPDFAYTLCAEAASAASVDLDLSSWTLAFSGA